MTFEAVVWDVPTPRTMPDMIVGKCWCGWTHSCDYENRTQRVAALKLEGRRLRWHLWTTHPLRMLTIPLRKALS